MARRREQGPDKSPPPTGAAGPSRAGRGVRRDPGLQRLHVIFASSPERHIPANTVLFAPDATAENVYLLERGSVDLYRLTPRGRRLVLRRMNPGEVFGFMGVLGRSEHEKFAESVRRSVVRVASVGQFKQAVKANPELALGLLTLIGERLTESEERCVGLAYSPVEARVAQLLAERADPSSGAVHNLTHREIADTIGAVRQTVSSVLAALERRRLIRREFRSVFVLDMSRLVQLAATEH